MIKFSRVWNMPSSDTFSIPEIEAFAQKYFMKSKVSVDPFARNCRMATYRNDLNPKTAAESHTEAGEFLDNLVKDGVKADLLVLDWPYSPRQVKECYDSIGKTISTEHTQTARVKGEWRRKAIPLLTDSAVVLTFGWNTVGFGNGFDIEEIMLVCHGGDHNDTICMAERRRPETQRRLL